jgi:hypothetical protein
MDPKARRLQHPEGARGIHNRLLVGDLQEPDNGNDERGLAAIRAVATAAFYFNTTQF